MRTLDVWLYEDARYSSMRTHSSKTKQIALMRRTSSEIKKNWLPTQLSIFTWRYWRMKSRFLLFWPRSKPRADPCWPNVTLKRRFRQQKNNNSCCERRMVVTRNLCCKTSTTWLLRCLCWRTSKGRLQCKKKLCQERFLQGSRQKMKSTACSRWESVCLSLSLCPCVGVLCVSVCVLVLKYI